MSLEWHPNPQSQVQVEVPPPGTRPKVVKNFCALLVSAASAHKTWWDLSHTSRGPKTTLEENLDPRGSHECMQQASSCSATVFVRLFIDHPLRVQTSSEHTRDVFAMRLS